MTAYGPLCCCGVPLPPAQVLVFAAMPVTMTSRLTGVLQQRMHWWQPGMQPRLWPGSRVSASWQWTCAQHSATLLCRWVGPDSRTNQFVASSVMLLSGSAKDQGSCFVYEA